MAKPRLPIRGVAADVGRPRRELRERDKFPLRIFLGAIPQARRARPIRGHARGGASSRGPLASASHEAGARGKGGWHAARRNSARSARAGDLRPGRRPALVVDFLARFPEARSDPLGDVLRLFGPQYLPHSGNVLGLGKASARQM